MARRVLLDECVWKRFAREFPEFEMRTVGEMQWSGKRNGELLRLMSAEGFSVWLTVDKNIPFEQNLSGLDVGVVIIRAVGNRLVDLLPPVPKARIVIEAVRPGQLLEVR